MKDINAWIGTGRLTRDAELKYINNGTPCCSFSIAVNRSVKKNDAWVDEASFLDCTLWGKFGETMNQYLTRGKAVTIHGELQQQRWEKDGQAHSKVVIIVQDLKLGGDSSGAKQGQGDGQQSTPRSVAPAAGNDDDLPF